MFFFRNQLKPFAQAILIPLNHFYEKLYQLFPKVSNPKSIPRLLNHQVFLLYIQMRFKHIFRNGSKARLTTKDLFHHIHNHLVNYLLEL